ncbi:MAG: tetratricopeptide repeat protein [Acidobacteriia bacterium]|nr:tetratricopeptide repeat protein [Terriglobia bacterium]MYC67206.1 tetratricopeptide repeat protein [Terriglobia bacterium]
MILKKVAHYALTTCLLLMVAAVAIPNPQEKNYKDRAEYDVITKVYGEADPAAKLALLDEWTEKYPETDYHVERASFYLDSYQKTGQTAEAVEAAKTLLTKVPDSFTAHYVITLSTPYLGKADDQTVSDGIDAANAVLKLVDQQFANKPETVAQEAWDNAKQQSIASSHLTIGWGRMQQKDNSAAEGAFREVLSIDPSRGQVSYWLGQVILAQQDAAKYDLAFLSFARAALYDGPNSMPAEGRTQVLEYVQNLLKGNYGDEAYDLYWPKIEEIAKATALSSERIELKSSEELQFEADQKSREENPMLWVFKDLKTRLLEPTGDSIWADLNGKLTPKMNLYVVSASPPERPATINLTSEPGGPTEVVLNLENRRRSGLRTGSMLTIDGVASGLSKSPFRLTLTDGHTF